MASSFGALAFRSVRDDVWVALPARDSLATERPVPNGGGGGFVAVDAAGLGAHHYDALITVLPAVVAAWRAALGTIDALTVADVAYGDAVLVQLSDEQVLLDRSLHTLQARWLLDAEAYALTDGDGGGAGGGAGSGLTGGGGDDGTGADGNASDGTYSFPCWPAEPMVLLHADTGYYGYSSAGDWLYPAGIRLGTPLQQSRWRYGRIEGATTTGAHVPTIVWSWESGCKVYSNDPTGQWPVGVLPLDSMQTTARTLFYAAPAGVGLSLHGLYRCGAHGVWLKIWDAPSLGAFSFGAGGLEFDGLGGFLSDDTVWVAIEDGSLIRVWMYNPILPESPSGIGTSVATFATVGSNVPAVGLMRGSEDGTFCVVVARVDAVWGMYVVTASGATAATGAAFSASMTELLQRGTTWVGMVPGDGLYRSSDDGATWAQVYTGDCLRATPGDTDEWWSARADEATLLRSTDDGATWTEIPYATALGSSPPTPTTFDAILGQEMVY
jgi:hypothetical protein